MFVLDFSFNIRENINRVNTLNAVLRQKKKVQEGTTFNLSDSLKKRILGFMTPVEEPVVSVAPLLDGKDGNYKVVIKKKEKTNKIYPGYRFSYGEKNYVLMEVLVKQGNKVDRFYTTPLQTDTLEGFDRHFNYDEQRPIHTVKVDLELEYFTKRLEEICRTSVDILAMPLRLFMNHNKPLSCCQ